MEMGIPIKEEMGIPIKEEMGIPIKQERYFVFRVLFRTKDRGVQSHPQHPLNHDRESSRGSPRF